MSNFLIVTFSFPPHYRVGARRWELFGSHLSSLGHKVIVYTSKSKYKGSAAHSPHSNMNIIRRPNRYPESLMNFKSSLLHKLKYRFFDLVMRSVEKGNPYDYSVFWNGYFENEIPKLIKEHGVDHVIITGGPYRYFYYGVLLKRKLGCNVFVDYRDPWTTRKGFLHNHNKRFKVEREYEQFVLSEADGIIVASPDIESELIKAFPAVTNLKERTWVVENGIDARDAFNPVSDLPVSESKHRTIRLLYYGGIGCEVEHFEAFMIALSELEKEFDLQVEFYGNMNQRYNDIIDRFDLSSVERKGRISSDQFLEKAANVDFFLYFKPYGRLKDSFGVKFYDYLRGRRMILTITPEGRVRQSILREAIGVILDPDNLMRDLKEAFKSRLAGSLRFDKKVEEMDVFTAQHQMDTFTSALLD